MDDEGGAAAKDGVVLVLAGFGVALVAALAKTDHAFQSEVPTPRPLAEIASHCPEIADLRRGHRGCRFPQAGELSSHLRVLFQLRQRDERADGQAVGTHLDAIQTWNGLEIHHPARPDDVVLHRGEEILTPGDRLRALVAIGYRLFALQPLDRFRNGCSADPFERFHVVLPGGWRPLNILSGVIGSSRTRTPEALNTALATAPTVGMSAGSPTPITACRVSASSMSATISGISSVPGSL